MYRINTYHELHCEPYFITMHTSSDLSGDSTAAAAAAVYFAGYLCVSCSEYDSRDFDSVKKKEKNERSNDNINNIHKY